MRLQLKTFTQLDALKVVAQMCQIEIHVIAFENKFHTQHTAAFSSMSNNIISISLLDEISLNLFDWKWTSEHFILIVIFHVDLNWNR